MADSSAINTLNQHIADVTAQITALNNDIIALKGDALLASQIAYMKAHNITDVNTQLNNPDFPGNRLVTSGGLSSVANVDHSGVTHYNTLTSQIDAKQVMVGDLNQQLQTANTQMLHLQETAAASPANQQAIASINAAAATEVAKTNYMQASTRYYIIGAVVIVILIIGAIVIIRRRKPGAAAAA